MHCEWNGIQFSGMQDDMLIYKQKVLEVFHCVTQFTDHFPENLTA